MPIPPRLVAVLAQFDFAFEHLVMRLVGLSDAESLWEPVPISRCHYGRGAERGGTRDRR